MSDAPGLPAPADPEALAAHVVAALGGPGPTRRGLLLAVDYDGTIAPIAPTPDAARASDAALKTLELLAAGTDTVAVISGRGLDDLRARIPVPRVHLISEHGLRLQPAGGAPVRQLAAALDPAVLEHVRRRLPALVRSVAGWLIEDKGVSLAVHHRGVAPQDLEPTLTRVRELLEQAALDGGSVQYGKAMLELRPAGAQKGQALSALVAAATPSSPDPHVLMIGDDLTDEGAFLVARTNRGDAVLVADESRHSHANHVLRGPEEVVAFLAALARLLRRPLGR